MSTEFESMMAENAFRVCCEALDERKWNYKKDEEKLTIHIGIAGDDLPMLFTISINADDQRVALHSTLPFQMPKHNRDIGSLVTNFINYRLANGGFDYNIQDGTIRFRLSCSFRGSVIEKDCFTYMIDLSCFTVNQYNNKLFMLSKDEISFAEFLDLVT